MKKEKCVIIIKPDAQERGLVGRIIQRFEEAGMKMDQIRSVWPEDADIEAHYQHLKPEIVEEIKAYFNHPMFPLIVILVSGHNAIAVCRKLVGATEPFAADPGTIRGDFGNEAYATRAGMDKGQRAIRNLVHASDSEEAAEVEYTIWFRS